MRILMEDYLVFIKEFLAPPMLIDSGDSFRAADRERECHTGCDLAEELLDLMSSWLSGYLSSCLRACGCEPGQHRIRVAGIIEPVDGLECLTCVFCGEAASSQLIPSVGDARSIRRLSPQRRTG